MFLYLPTGVCFFKKKAWIRAEWGWLEELSFAELHLRPISASAPRTLAVGFSVSQEHHWHFLDRFLMDALILGMPSPRCSLVLCTVTTRPTLLYCINGVPWLSLLFLTPMPFNKYTTLTFSVLEAVINKSLIPFIFHLQLSDTKQIPGPRFS